MMIAVKSVVKKAFDAVGLEIRKKQPDIARTSMAGGLRQLAGLGFRPQTVIDAGVASATQELYEEFPQADILLIEPQAEFEPFLQKICSRYRAQYVLAAAGASRGTAVLNVHHDKYSSSLLKEVEGAAVDGIPRDVPVVTIDDLIGERNLCGPYLIKLDVQGAELHVLEGAKRTLLETEVVILEATLFATMIGGPQLFELLEWMKKSGFVVYDIFGPLYRPWDDALCQVDLLFVREGGRFRRSHAYARPDQRAAQARISEEHVAELARRRT